MAVALTRVRRFQKGLLDRLGSRRGRLVVSLTLYGGALGGAALLVNLLSRTKYPETPEHMPADATILLSGGAAFVCAILGGLFAWWLSGGQGGHARERAQNIVVWLAAGFGFGIVSPVVTGASLPMSTMLLGWAHGLMSAGELPVEAVTSLMRAPSFAFTHGVFGLFTGMLAGALFGAGAWLVDIAVHSSNRAVSAYAPYAISAILSAVFYGIAALGPAESLTRLG